MIKRTMILREYETLKVSFTDECYVRLVCTKKGIRVIASKTKPKSGFVVRYEGFLRIPGSIVKAYGLNEGEFDLITAREKKEYFIDRPCKGKLPKPYISITNNDDSEIDLATLNKVADGGNGHYSMISASRLNLGFLKMPPVVRVTVHLGKCLRVDVTEPNAEEMGTLPFYGDLKGEYRANFANFCSEKVTFLYETSSNSIPIPKPFRVAAGIAKGDSMTVYSSKDETGRAIYHFAPEITVCAYCGEEINPVTKMPQETVLCDDCIKSTPDIGDILKEVEEIKKLVKKLTETNTRLSSDLTKAQNGLKDITDIAREALEEKESLQGELQNERQKVQGILALLTD